MSSRKILLPSDRNHDHSHPLTLNVRLLNNKFFLDTKDIKN